MLALHFPSPSSRPSLPLARECAGGCAARCRPRIRDKRYEQVDAPPSACAGVAFPRRPGYAAAASSADASAGTTAEAQGLEEMAAPFPSGLNPNLMPRHVAVIMDGNSRWARERGLPTSAGHEAGYRALREIVRLSGSWGVKVLTVFAFSSENWLRPKTEVDFLMRLFEGVIRENLEDFKRQGIRLCIIGDSTKLPRSLQDLAKEAAEVTKHNAVIELLVAVSYSGRGDIVQACQKIAQRVRDRLLEPADITESVIEEELETNCTINSPYPDLLIRTSGELRLSNFLLWQSAYTELCFARSLWPDFGETEYIEALSSFQERKRRFGQRM
uniref:Alkyl transferase n=1 Tax=Anthurium amnicola TaxID=1678845 RepID=A0A1D1XW26_9ARAE